MSFNHVMVDLETLGPAPEAVIASIGAVRMDLEKLILDANNFFYQIIDIEDAESYGLTVDMATMKWWMGQEEAARYIFTSKDAKKLPEVLSCFTAWALKEVAPGDLQVWGKGSTYDNVILRNAYRAVRQKAPWYYRGDLCFRTMLRMFDAPDVRVEGGTKHNALDDAVNQAETLLRILRKVRLAQASVRVGA